MWVRKMTKHLPYHRDQFFLSLMAATHGQYTCHFTDSQSDKPTDPDTAFTKANRAMDAMSNRADAAIRAYKQKKAQGRL